MSTSSKIVPTALVGLGGLAAIALIFTLARHEVGAALIPLLVVCAIAVVAPHATPDR